MIDLQAKYTPLFYSEISSSFLIYHLFHNHKNIMIDFVREHVGIVLKDPTVEREFYFPKAGAIDLLIKGDRCKILIEVKVHDYYSVTSGQIGTYWDAAVDKFTQDEMYFIYLTQFNEHNKINPLSPSIYEVESAAPKLRNRLKHVNWGQFHECIGRHSNVLSADESQMFELQKEWMTAYVKELETKAPVSGRRDLFSYYFDDIPPFDLKDELPGNETTVADRKVFRVDLASNDQRVHDKILEIIGRFARSKNSEVVRNEKKETLDASSKLLARLAGDVDSWVPLLFYARLFTFVKSCDNILLNGKESNKFSLTMKLKGKGEISLCTIYSGSQHRIEFGLLR